MIRQLEALAYSDVRDVVQWDKEAIVNSDGDVTGFKHVMQITPSRLLTPEQAAMVKGVTTKAGELKFDAIDRLQALAHLARVLGMVAPDAPNVVNNTQMNIGQVNMTGEQSALEAARRLAFALERAARAGPLVIEAVSHAPDEEPKE